MKKKVLVIVLCVLVVAIGAGVWGYNYFFGVDHNLRTQLQEEFSEDFFSFEDIDLQDIGDMEASNQLKPSTENKNPEKDIPNKYIGKLERLEYVTDKKIEVLFERAYEEYQQQKSGNQLNQTQLARKYLQAANMLEESMEAIFQDIIKEMEAELQENQLSDDLMKEIVATYNNRIKEKRSAIMQQIEGAI
ncbi:MAG: hypothetical protein JJT76_04040 [Clostridiaceae bacterium]|nr:hypothetical protein [Clostridiaceae bacterium]